MPRICILLMLSSIFVVLIRVSHSEEIVTQQSQPRSLSPELVETVHTKLPVNGETSTVHASESLSQAQGEINFNLGDSTAPSLPSTAEQLTPTPDGERVFVVAAGAGGAAAVVVIPETGDKESGAADGDNGGLADQTSSGEPEVSESLSTVPATQADQAGQLDLHSLSVTEPVQEEQLLPTAPQITVLQDSGPTQSLELPQGDDLPAAQHTHHIAQDGGTQASFSQAERVTLEPVQATDSLHSLRPEAWTEVSQLPEGLGGRVIEP
ncbi:uncharacterized protein LOC101850912, partial [Aplysia californica]|uniref:Uncharacterized protein LOC101850912 n=1 Tax=Aplysia californica TaxID=6500 RepID=A0ABM0K545_APLCA